MRRRTWMPLAAVLYFGTSACFGAQAWGDAMSGWGEEQTRRNEQANRDGQSWIVTESSINGDFRCWDGDTVFVLLNGQVWQQSELGLQLCLLWSPRVTIIERNGRQLMVVEGVDKTVRVRLIG